MTSQPDRVRPPRVATWIVNLFASADESILGDLLEEYSGLASESGVRFAQRWYWRQTVKTIPQLAGAGFRGAPWSTPAAVLGGFWLHRFVSRLPDKLLSAITDRYLAFWSTHFAAYMWVLNGMVIEHVIGSMIVGYVVALAVKGREMIATMALGLVLCALIGAALVWEATHLSFGAGWMLWSLADPLAIAIGGAIVRTRRSAAKPAFAFPAARQ
jgi:hypothetical protein